MGHYILHKDGVYNIYSTVSERVVFSNGVSLEELKRYVLEFGTKGLFDELAERLKRARLNGCSGQGKSLESCILTNRSGPGESRLSMDEFVARFLTMGDGLEGGKIEVLELSHPPPTAQIQAELQLRQVLALERLADRFAPTVPTVPTASPTLEQAAVQAIEAYCSSNAEEDSIGLWQAALSEYERIKEHGQ